MIIGRSSHAVRPLRTNSNTEAAARPRSAHASTTGWSYRSAVNAACALTAEAMASAEVSMEPKPRLLKTAAEAIQETGNSPAKTSAGHRATSST
jgi:hypothetical protein